MTKLRVDEDSCPLSDFEAGIASFVKQVNETHRPTVLTQHGREVAVLVGVHEYQRMQERLELLEAIYAAEAQIKKGEGVPHAETKAMILRRWRT
ncbi:type II toxin-antitoxin system Phd/YefM family antitoxin [Alkalimonas amylolytica]|uniref:Antitoxin n=1 Tax=Alkalimonas amylolytica TaxID=152573 RepID=A0A1H4G7T5_ALKAM|nr:type II toxin-antitoxin system Phd/YefM family antitoxin [Alkalimonas amylolytica]SEB05090.1 prevent-host-death family protein [Alkalimonas amylolytica]